MKKVVTLVLAALLIMGLIATVALADSPKENTKPDFYKGPDKEFFQRMWEFCHGPNGMMNYYYQNSGMGMMR